MQDKVFYFYDMHVFIEKKCHVFTTLMCSDPNIFDVFSELSGSHLQWLKVVHMIRHNNMSMCYSEDGKGSCYVLSQFLLVHRYSRGAT